MREIARKWEADFIFLFVPASNRKIDVAKFSFFFFSVPSKPPSESQCDAELTRLYQPCASEMQEVEGEEFLRGLFQDLSAKGMRHSGLLSPFLSLFAICLVLHQSNTRIYP